MAFDVSKVKITRVAKPNQAHYEDQPLVRRKLLAVNGYKKIVFATDQDLDGFTIRGLLIGFFKKYAPDFIKYEMIGMLQTPIMAEIKNGMPVKWIYDLADADKLKGQVKYFKGLGSHKKEGLKKIYKKDGLEKMLVTLSVDQGYDDIIDSWLNSKRAEDRKKMIKQNEFDLIKL